MVLPRRGPKRVVSSANIQEFIQKGTAYSTFFEDSTRWISCGPGRASWRRYVKARIARRPFDVS
jgi:hypothetical protein